MFSRKVFTALFTLLRSSPNFPHNYSFSCSQAIRASDDEDSRIVLIQREIISTLLVIKKLVVFRDEHFACYLDVLRVEYTHSSYF